MVRVRRTRMSRGSTEISSPPSMRRTVFCRWSQRTAGRDGTGGQPCIATRHTGDSKWGRHEEFGNSPSEGSQLPVWLRDELTRPDTRPPLPDSWFLRTREAPDTGIRALYDQPPSRQTVPLTVCIERRPFSRLSSGKVISPVSSRPVLQGLGCPSVPDSTNRTGRLNDSSVHIPKRRALLAKGPPLRRNETNDAVPWS